MAYTKHIWDCDELITADKLNHIEDGIVEAEQSGGGGSDLQILRKTITATVTTYANSQFIAVFPLNAGGESINPNNILGITGIGVSDPVTEHSLVQAYLMDYQITGNQVTVAYWNPTSTSQTVECSVTVTYKG